MLPGIAEVDVIGPSVAYVIAEAMKQPFKRGYGRDRPVADEGNTFAIGRTASTGRRTWTARPIVWASRIAADTKTFLKREKKDSIR